MTLAELAVSYRTQVRLLQSRIRLVEELPESSPDQDREKERQLRLLSAMLRDMRDMAVWCEHYYDRDYHYSDHYRI